MPANTITPEFFRNNLTEMANWHFHLLAGSPDPEKGNQLKVGSIGDIVNALKLAYDYVLIDLDVRSRASACHSLKAPT